MSADVADVLDRAADLLERDGWTQGTYREAATGKRCVVGAIADAMDRRYVALSRPMVVLGGRLRRDVTWWNDDKGRTAAEVIAKLREVAALERAL